MPPADMCACPTAAHLSLAAGSHLHLADAALAEGRYFHTVIDVAAAVEVSFVPNSCKQHFGSPTIHCLINK